MKRLLSMNATTQLKKASNGTVSFSLTPLVKGRVLNILSLYDSYDLEYQYEISCITKGNEG